MNTYNLDTLEAIKKLILKRTGPDGRLWILDCVEALRYCISADVEYLFKKGLLATLNETNAYIYVGLSEKAVENIFVDLVERFNQCNDIDHIFDFDGLSDIQQLLMQLIVRKIYPHPRVVDYSRNDLKKYLESTMYKIGFIELTNELIKSAIIQLKNEGKVESVNIPGEFYELVWT